VGCFLGGEIGIIICAIVSFIACVVAVIYLRKSLARGVRKYCVSRRVAGRERMLLKSTAEKPSRENPVMGRSINNTSDTPAIAENQAITSGENRLAVSGPPGMHAIEPASAPAGRGSKGPAPQPPTSPLIVTPGSVVRVSPIYGTAGVYCTFCRGFSSGI
jgi:hypothetical protein